MSDTGCIGTPEHAAHRGQEARARHYESAALLVYADNANYIGVDTREV